MINLLPPQYKENILYARRNTKLVRWAVAGVFVLIGMVAIIVFGQIYLGQTTTNYSKQVAQTQAELKAQKLEDVQKQVETMSSTLKLIVQVLSKEVLFSKLIKQIGAVMPANSVLSNIDISKVQGGIDLTASAKDYQTATQVQVNLQDPSNKLFDKVDLVSVNCGAASSDSPYPCAVNLRAQFAKNNPFLFINNTTTGSTP